MTHELNILTNDGWVVTLLSDHAIKLGAVRISSIIVQPRDEYEQRICDDAGGGYPRDVTRTEYRLRSPDYPNFMNNWYEACPGRWLRRGDYREVREWDTGSWGADDPYSKRYPSAEDAIRAIEE
jgi:hypothetical protein